MANLYKVSMEYERVMELIEENDGEMTEEIWEYLSQISDQKDALIDNACRHIVNTNTDISAINTEIERLNGMKERALQNIERSKNLIRNILHQFNMRNPNKKATNYVFKLPLFSGYTKISESVNLDEAALYRDFEPIKSIKSSKFVNYSVSATVTPEQLKQINALGIFPITAYAPKVNKNDVKEYLKDIAAGKQLTFDEGATQIVTDEIANIASIVAKESLIIKDI